MATPNNEAHPYCPVIPPSPLFNATLRLAFYDGQMVFPGRKRHPLPSQGYTKSALRYPLPKTP